jgi:putative transposase
VVTPAAKLEAVAHAREVHEVSERRACQTLGLDRSMVRYLGRRASDADVRFRIPEFAGHWRRFGYRHLHLLQMMERCFMNLKRFRRRYREEGLQVCNHGGRKRALGQRAPVALPGGSKQRWSLDFMFDSCADRRCFPIMVVVDDFTP